MTSRPMVSIIIPTYNRAGVLPRALDSVIAQTHDPWEIVIVDDGSTDDTRRVIETYARCLADRLVYVRQPNAGPSAARNRGIEACSGQFVAFLDSDDEYLPHKLARQLALFERRPELGLVYGDSAYVDLDGMRHESVFDDHGPLARHVPFDEVAPGLCVCRGSLFDWLIQEYFIATIAGMVRRDVLGDTIRFPVGHAYAEEWLFYLKVSRAGHAGFVNEPLCLHHFTKGSLARTDKHRNTIGRRQILYAIRASFGDLSPHQLRALHHNLATTCRQLGYDAYHARNFREAARYFTESFRFNPRPRTAGAVIQAAVRDVPRSLVQVVSGSRRGE